MKILVLGAQGMAGHVVRTYLESMAQFEVWGLARGLEVNKNRINLDVSQTQLLHSEIENNKFDVVINCIGILNKTAEENPEIAVWFNSYFPHLLEKWGSELNFKLIHISTDCVFSGKEGGYSEISFKNGIGFYAQSKALGEVINKKDLTFRTSIVGPELKLDGIGLLHWFLNQKGTISGYKEAFWTGVTTIELAKAIAEAIYQDTTGLYHLVNTTKISKYDLLGIFNKVFRNNEIIIEDNSNYSVDKSLINNRTDFNYKIPTYEDMVREMKDWIDNHSNLYPHYKL